LSFVKGRNKEGEKLEVRKGRGGERKEPNYVILHMLMAYDLTSGFL